MDVQRDQWQVLGPTRRQAAKGPGLPVQAHASAPHVLLAAHFFICKLAIISPTLLALYEVKYVLMRF